VEDEVMSDLVKRLRDTREVFWGGADKKCESPPPIYLEAADAIEVLQAENTLLTQRVEELEMLAGQVYIATDCRGVVEKVFSDEQEAMNWTEDQSDPEDYCVEAHDVE
jgi:hypothetical protein